MGRVCSVWSKKKNKSIFVAPGQRASLVFSSFSPSPFLFITMTEISKGQEEMIKSIVCAEYKEMRMKMHEMITNLCRSEDSLIDALDQKEWKMTPEIRSSIEYQLNSTLGGNRSLMMMCDIYENREEMLKKQMKSSESKHPAYRRDRKMRNRTLAVSTYSAKNPRRSARIASKKW